MSESHTVIVTRSEPGASRTADALREDGFTPILSPLFRLEPADPFPTLDLGNITDLVFTSATGVRVFADHCTERDLHVWAVGGTTANTAREAGFTSVTAGASDAAGLLELIASDAEPESKLLHLANALAGPGFSNELTRRGVECRYVPIYRPHDADALSEGAESALASAEPCTVLFHSSHAAEVFQGLAEGVSLAPHSAIAISQAVADSLCGLDFGRVVIAAQPSERGLFVALTTLTAPE